MIEQPDELTEEIIRYVLHASRVVPFAVANPHGLLGLEQLASAVVAHRADTQNYPPTDRVRRPIVLPVRTWEKLHTLADTDSQASPRPASAGEIAAATIEQYLLDAASS
jgi:hypothetical protein